MASTKEEKDVPQTEEQNKYELMLILAPDLSQDDTEKELKKIRKQIKDLKGEIYHEDVWDVRDLAYIIKKYDKGYYVILYFTFDPQNLKELEKEFLLDQKILRHLIVKSPKGYEIKKLADFELPPREERRKEAKEKKEAQKKREPVKKEEPKKVEKAEEKEEKPAKEVKEVKEEKVEKVEKKEEKEEKPAEEKEEIKEEEPKKEEKKKTMDISDLDSKLESILDDPDIDIKL